MFENQHIPVYIGNILESLIGIKSAAKLFSFKVQLKMELLNEVLHVRIPKRSAMLQS